MRISAALQKQATRDLAPIWEISATVDAFDQLGNVPVGTWPIIIGADVPPGALGFHTDKNGQPLSLVAELTDVDTLCLTCSHEMLEMLVDPSGMRMTPGDSPMPDQDRVNFLVEVCDPCESAQFGYTINNLLVSDFYTPHYFDPVRSAGVRYSFTGAIVEPRQVLRGGYLSWEDPVSKHFFQEIFQGDEPQFRDLGALENTSLTPREFIDRKTAEFTMAAIKGGRPAAQMASNLTAAKCERACHAQARTWGEVIEKAAGRGAHAEGGPGGEADHSVVAIRRAPRARR
jgi:hypothetical protein